MAVSSFRMKTLDISCLKTTKYKKIKEKRQKISGKFLLRKKKTLPQYWEDELAFLSRNFNWCFINLIRLVLCCFVALWINISIFTSISVDDISMLFRSRLFRCWSTAGQSPFTESARTRLRISHLRIDGGVLVSNNTLEPLRDCANGTEDPSDPGLGGRRDCRRLEGFPPGAELLENIIAN